MAVLVVQVFRQVEDLRPGADLRGEPRTDLHRQPADLHDEVLGCGVPVGIDLRTVGAGDDQPGLEWRGGERTQQRLTGGACAAIAIAGALDLRRERLGRHPGGMLEGLARGRLQAAQRSLLLGQRGSHVFQLGDQLWQVQAHRGRSNNCSAL